MKISVSGQHMQVGDSFRQYIEENIEKHVKKYFERAVHATITLTKEKQHLIKTDILVNQGDGSGTLIRSSEHDPDAYRSFDMALEKATAQLRKYKTRLKNHHKDKESRMLEIDAKKYIMSPFEDDQLLAGEGDAPTIISEKIKKIETMTVGDAVMTMDLVARPFLLFINKGTNKLSIVYYREDGNIAWVDLPSVS